MESYFLGAFCIIFGILAIAFRSNGARRYVKWQKFLGVSVTEDKYKFWVIIGGIVFITVGLLSLFGIIRFQ